MSSQDDISNADLFGLGDVFSRVNRGVAAGDGMFLQNRKHYFIVGASALHNILDCLRAARVSRGSVQSVLDYACGYGRVLRWLVAGFPGARVLGVDADRKATTNAAEVLGVETHTIDTTLAKQIGASFDLIWVGSLLTHLPRAEAVRVLSYLRGHLSTNGVLVFTTHGPLVFGRLKSRERLYNLSDAAAGSVVAQYEASGYGFASYDRRNGYGISAVTAKNVLEMVEQAALSPVCYRERGWAQHQDVFACVLQNREFVVRQQLKQST